MTTQLRPILIIAEDDPDDQFLIRMAVEETCHPEILMHFVKDGIELLNFLQGNGADKPGLILLDLNMPRKDGREALREIKSNPVLRDIPTVILTTSNREEDIDYCRQFGIMGYYSKPGSIYELRDIMGKLCEEYLQ